MGTTGGMNRVAPLAGLSQWGGRRRSTKLPVAEEQIAQVKQIVRTALVKHISPVPLAEGLRALVDI